jgi:clan AA aspartic protease
VIQGRVVGFEARVNVSLRLPGQPGIAIEFVVDTGFAGALALPPAAVSALGLPFHQRITSRLADGSRKLTNVYRATIDWDGAVLNVALLALGDPALLGTSLLHGYNVNTDFLDQGDVRIQRCP